jgi:hypothetical protein
VRRSLVGSVVALAVVVGLVGVLQAWGGQPPARGPGFVVTPPVTASVTPPPIDASARRRPALLVLNNSRVPGLAARAAAGFRAAGWPVAGTGNLRGRLRATTVYFTPGEADAARALAERFPAIRRVVPRQPGLPGEAPLTVVVTRDVAAGYGSSRAP